MRTGEKRTSSQQQTGGQHRQVLFKASPLNQCHFTASDFSSLNLRTANECVTHAGSRPAFVKRAERYLCTLWKLLGRAVQQHRSLVWQVHVDAVGGRVVGHGQFVIAVVAHLLHDLHTERHRKWAERDRKWALALPVGGVGVRTARRGIQEQNLWGRTP